MIQTRIFPKQAILKLPTFSLSWSKKRQFILKALLLLSIGLCLLIASSMYDFLFFKELTITLSVFFFSFFIKNKTRLN